MRNFKLLLHLKGNSSFIIYIKKYAIMNFYFENDILIIIIFYIIINPYISYKK